MNDITLTSKSNKELEEEERKKNIIWIALKMEDVTVLHKVKQETHQC